MRAFSGSYSRVLLWLIALVLAGLAQWWLAAGNGPVWKSGVLFALSAIPAMIAWGNRPLVGTPNPREALPPLRPRPLLLALALTLAAGGWIGAANNTFTFWGVLLWLASIATWLAGWRAFSRGRSGHGEPREPWRRWQVAAFVAILLAAAIFRFWRLDTLPPEMTSDHAEKLLDVLDVLEGQRPVFFIRNTGREPAQFYLTAFLAGPVGLGLGYVALKAGTALIGWLTVPLTYAVARVGLGLPRGVALIAMALLAVSKWHVAISRVGLRFPYAPFGVALTLIFFFRALRLGGRRHWLLTGAAFGVALYGYTPVRIIPLLLAAGAFFWLVLEQMRGRTGLAWRSAWLDVLLLPLTTLIVFLPLFRYSLENPETFWVRSTSRAVGGDNLLAVFALNVRNAILMFHVRGDQVWVNTLPGDPVLDRVSGALFVLGVAVALWVSLRRWRAVEWTLLAALPLLVLPSVLSLAFPRENPSVVRAGGALPIVMILTSVPLYELLRSLWQRGQKHIESDPPDPNGRPAMSRRRVGAYHVLVGSFAILLLVGVAFLNGRVYFGPYAAQYDLYSWNSSEVAAEILERAPAIGGVEHAYVASWPHWIDTRNVALNMGHPRWDSVLYVVATVGNPDTFESEPRMVIVHPADTRSLILLESIWDDATVELIQSRVPGKEFVVVTHPDYAQP